MRFASAVLPDDGLRGEFDRLVDADEDSQSVWDSFYDRVHGYAASMTLERLVDWFVALHDPATILNVHYGVDGVEYLDYRGRRLILKGISSWVCGSYG